MMHLIRLLFFGLALCVPVALRADAGLTWLNTSVKRRAAPEDLQTSCVFGFRNDSAETVTITDIQSGCGCTTAMLDKRTFQPGEGGELRMLFKHGSYLGRQHKTLRVYVDKEPGGFTLLSLSVDIPAAFSIQTKHLSWTKAAFVLGVTKEIVVAADRAPTLRMGEIMCGSPSFKVEVVEREEARAYVVKVTPLGTPPAGCALIQLSFEAPVGTPRKASIVLMLREEQ